MIRQQEEKKQVNVRGKLEAVIQEAQKEIKERRIYHTKASILALEYMIQKAIAALKQEEPNCFNRKREFIKVDSNTQIQFALRRYTMVPTYLPDGYVYSEYGLEPALKWFQEEDMLSCEEAKLDQKINALLLNTSKACDSFSIGNKIGYYGQKEKESLTNAIQKLKSAKEREGRALAAVECFDAYDDFRKSKILRSDFSQDDTLFYTSEDWEKLKKEVQKDSIKIKAYAQIKECADSNTLEDIRRTYKDYMEEVPYEELNTRYSLWSSTGKTVNFFTPKEIAYAKIKITLPSLENKSDGLGHVWLDNIGIFSADGEDVEIKNSDFELGERIPLHWIEKTVGNGVVKLEDREKFCKVGKKSLFLQNPSNMDEAGIEYAQRLDLKQSKGYTLFFDAKLDGKCKKGLEVTITYFDAMDKEIGDFVYYFNKKSFLSSMNYPLTAQCDAICYVMTDDIDYAKKAKIAILFSLNDFCQGAEHWMIENTRPDQSDAYGAVQGGRILCSLASAYSLIKKADCFEEAEKKQFYALVDYMLTYMLDLRNRTELSIEDAQRNCSNWQTDMCAGVVMMMLVLEDFPNRKMWLDNAIYILRAQLEFNINPDGSWPESIRYHFAALERFGILAKSLKINTGEDWLRETKLAEMFGYGVQVQTPPYVFFNGHRSTPPFGDHVLKDGSEYAILGSYINDIKEIDVSMAQDMYETWENAGKPLKTLKTEAIAIENLFCSDYKDLTRINKLQLTSCKDYKDSGIYLFRRNYGTDDESYIAVMASSSKIGHGHLDQGSFLLYYKKIPLIMDSGAEGYFDSSTQWHISSYSHACMQFQTKQTEIKADQKRAINLSAGTFSLEKGWVDVPHTSKVIACEMGGDTESITIEILNPEGQGRHIRKISIFHEESLYLIEDRVEDFEGEVLFNLPVVSKSCELDVNQCVAAQGYYGVDMEIKFNSKVKNIWLEEGRTIAFFPSEKPVGMLKYIRAVANARDGFCVILKPVDKR